MTDLYNPLPKPATAGASELAVYLSGITYDAQSNLLSLSVGLATGVENIQSFGLRLHYDDSQLSYRADTAYSLDQQAEDTPDVGFDAILSTGLTRGTGHVQRSDTTDYDDDASTTSFVKSNWTNVYDATQAEPAIVPFPNALETALYEMNFTVIGNITEVNVGFSADDLKVGSDYALTAAAAAPITIELDREASNETPDVTQTFVFTAASGKYLVDGSVAPTLTLLPGNTYAFDLSDSSLVTHPLKFKLDGVEWSSGITTTGTLGVDQITYVTLPSDFEGSFEYYCANHAGMGNDIQLSESTTLVPITLGEDALTGLELSFVSSTAEDSVVTVLDGQVDYSAIASFTHVTLEEGSYTADIAISDVISSLKHIVGLETLTGAGLIAADVDNDGDVAIADVISQLKHIVGLETLNTFDAVDTGGNQITEITAQTSDIQLILNGDVDLSTDLNQEYTYTI